LRREHVRRQHGLLVFEYVAKSGVTHTERIDDPILLDTVGALLRRRGGDLDELLVYRDGRDWRKVTSDDINSYVKAAVRLDVSAKDFRTWHGTVLGSVAMATEYLTHPADKPWSKTGLDKAIRRAVVAVSETLGNTPAVCRGSYINPASSNCSVTASPSNAQCPGSCGHWIARVMIRPEPWGCCPPMPPRRR
jgi:DNA topoisomerase IB